MNKFKYIFEQARERANERKGGERENRRNTLRAPEVDEKGIVRAYGEEGRDTPRSQECSATLMQFAKWYGFAKTAEREGKISH